MKDTKTSDIFVRECADLDPCEMRIQEEVEEFLQDLTLEHPFHDIFECLRRWDFQDRFGPKVIPLPRKVRPFTEEDLRDLSDRIEGFLGRLEDDFGGSYSGFIRDSFRFYTQTTSE